MSSRTGNVITGESLIADMVQAAKEKCTDAKVSTKKFQNKSLSLQSSIWFSNRRWEKNIAFDPEKSLSLEGDSGPYLQYATVRARSVLKKARCRNFCINRHANRRSIALEKYLYRFPEIVSSGLVNYAPQAIVGYLTELASTFNSWYAAEKLLMRTIKPRNIRLL